MGKTNQKLVIWVAEEWMDHPKVVELREKGHIVYRLDQNVLGTETPDLFLHPAAHAWGDSMWIYLENALKAARKRKYPPRKRKA